MRRKQEVWAAPARALEPMPDTSGSTVNGLGEKETRRPSPFFWHEPRNHEFGPMRIYTIGVMYGLDDGDEIMEAFHINRNFRPDLPVDEVSNPQFVHRVSIGSS
jgi:hypothetical protein